MKEQYSRIAILVACTLVILILPLRQTPTLAADTSFAANQATTSSEGVVTANQESRNKIASPYVTAKLLTNTKAIVAADKFKLGVELKMAPGWHTYYKVSGEAGLPTTIAWVLPEGFKALELEWEKPQKFRDGGIITYGYKNKTLIASTVLAPSTLPAKKTLKFGAQVKWLSCKEICIPGKAYLEISLPIAAKNTNPKKENLANFLTLGFKGTLDDIPDLNHNDKNQARKSVLDTDFKVAQSSKVSGGLAIYLILAFVGGFILNFMPCVLPVISIKILSFLEQANEDPKRVFRLGLTFSLGIIASFLALGSFVIAIQQAGQKIGWGFQFQYPVFVVAMAVIVLLLALSLFGIFYVQISSGHIDQLASKEGFIGTFFKGVLATVLSTPCTAPVLGTALGFAFAQSAWVILLVFFATGLGMSFPYIILTAKPDWMRYLPKPGVWMEKFKEIMGFFLLATVVWLLSVLGSQVGLNATISTAAFLLSVALSAWIMGRFTDLTSTNLRKVIIALIAICVVYVSYYYFLAPFPGLLSFNSQAIKAQSIKAQATESIENIFSSKNNHQGESIGIDWQPFSIEILDKYLAARKTILVDFTADWCLTCKFNEQTVLNTEPIIRQMKALNVVPLRADWTRQDPSIAKLLQKFGRSGVPLYVIFPAGRAAEPIVLPELITQAMVLDKLNEAGPSQ